MSKNPTFFARKTCHLKQSHAKTYNTVTSLLNEASARTLGEIIAKVAMPAAMLDCCHHLPTLPLF